MATARSGKTGYKKILHVQWARSINQQCGGALIAPWEIEQLDEEWLDVFLGLSDLPNLRTNYQAFENRLAERRRNHPNYRKYLN